MHLIRTLAPVFLPVTLAEVQSSAGPFEDDEDAKIMALIRSAVEQVDGRYGEIQMALITQTWEMRLDTFPGGWPGRPSFRWPAEFCRRKLEIEVPLPPLQAVEEIIYISGDTEVLLDPSEYVVAGVGDKNKARITPVTFWPSTDDVNESVTVTFRAGYGDSWNDVPETIRQGISYLVKDMYEGCESGMVEKLLRPYRVDLGIA